MPDYSYLYCFPEAAAAAPAAHVAVQAREVIWPSHVPDAIYAICGAALVVIWVLVHKDRR